MSAKWVELPERYLLMAEKSDAVLGQVVRDDPPWVEGQTVAGYPRWDAYDNAPEKHTGDSAMFLGRFPFLEQAKAAVEQAAQVI